MKKPLILATTLLLALAAIGGAYALWSDDLYIEGFVSTGDVDAEWSFVGCFDIEDKDVGLIDAFIDPIDPDVVHYVLTNGYPSYTADCELEYTYYGSIPVHVEMIEFLPGDLTGCVIDQSPTTGTFTALCNEMTIEWVDGLCVQLHENDRLAASLRVHIEQPAMQDWVYGFGVRIQLNQFNESSCP
jgi:hypothetical protein